MHSSRRVTPGGGEGRRYTRAAADDLEPGLIGEVTHTADGPLAVGANPTTTDEFIEAHSSILVPREGEHMVGDDDLGHPAGIRCWRWIRLDSGPR